MGMALLLSPPTGAVMKDAARAVKRLDSLTIQAVTAETLNELLGLPGMKVTWFAIEQQGEERYLHLFYEHQHDVAVCPRCGKATAGGYDQRPLCASPGYLGNEDICTLRRQTRAYEEHIYQRAQKTPRKHVVLQERLNESTVLDIFKKCAKEATRQSIERS